VHNLSQRIFPNTLEKEQMIVHHCSMILEDGQKMNYGAGIQWSIPHILHGTLLTFVFVFDELPLSVLSI